MPAHHNTRGVSQRERREAYAFDVGDRVIVTDTDHRRVRYDRLGIITRTCPRYSHDWDVWMLDTHAARPTICDDLRLWDPAIDDPWPSA